MRKTISGDGCRRAVGAYGRAILLTMIEYGRISSQNAIIALHWQFAELYERDTASIELIMARRWRIQG